MDNEIITTALSWIYYIVIPIVILINFVLGILIATSKVKPTRALGLGIIAGTVSWAIRFAFYIFQMSATGQQIYNSQTWVNLVVFVIGIAEMVMICFYIHKNYGRKMIYIPILILHLVPTVGTFLIILVVNGFHLFNRDGGIHISLMASALSIATSIAVNVLIIRVFYGNRMLEKVIPGYWKCRLITFVWSVITSLLNFFQYFLILYRQDHRDAPIVGMWDTNGENIYKLATILAALVALIIPVYVNMRVSRVSHRGVTGQLQPVYESPGNLEDTSENI